MTVTATRLSDLRLREGEPGNSQPALTAYWDPIGNCWTIGYGHTGKDVHASLVISVATAETLLTNDAQNADRLCSHTWPWYDKLDQTRQDAFADMAFNLGVGKLLTFHDFLGYMVKGDYQGAALDGQHTLWYKQVGDRAVTDMRRLSTGVR